MCIYKRGHSKRGIHFSWIKLWSPSQVDQSSANTQTLKANELVSEINYAYSDESISQWHLSNPFSTTKILPHLMTRETFLRNRFLFADDYRKWAGGRQPKNDCTKSCPSHPKINPRSQITWLNLYFFLLQGEKVQKGRNVILRPRMISYLGQPQDALAPVRKEHHTQEEISKGWESAVKQKQILAEDTSNMQ